jgi:TonB family protein
VEFDSGASSIAGGLERSEVEAVIRENISQIRFCYNRGLRNNPNLEGKVTSNFVIGADGSVRTSRLAGSSLGSAEVEDCIKDRVASWRFPQPRGGGQVQVNYPFLLKAN